MCAPYRLKKLQISGRFHLANATNQPLMRVSKNEGLERAKNEGKKRGRPNGAIKTTTKVHTCKIDSQSQSQTANQLNIGIATVKRHWDK